MEKKKYYGGSLFINRTKDKESMPDLSGDVEITMDLLRYLVEKAKKGEDLKMRIACWIREGKNGKFYSVQLSEERPKVQPKANVFDDDIPF